ncbi:hypothetical protein DACRYDRAFT_118410 [Dacryopinax primogenitus]|uniref:Uncharacterized protein n=1 Tax=Dacryopinax primogenitus (strain DJM 731) TaxID=1858805 RepID=M5FS15_DACPD|nr:uncharacterized protein DACRYDRAFT_118410 [Dacryopinax primogenitus]EJT98568.1 hypothetical protein DACRYDRAFT_118410 [Dacryopinax primogenitus]
MNSPESSSSSRSPSPSAANQLQFDTSAATRKRRAGHGSPPPPRRRRNGEGTSRTGPPGETARERETEKIIDGELMVKLNQALGDPFAIDYNKK